jgi:hypothetical protein
VGVLQEIEKAGLTGELDKQFEAFFIKPDSKAKAGLKMLIDKHGLQAPEVMKQVGTLQRSDILKPGIYRTFKDIDQSLKSGNGKPAETAKAPSAPTSAKTETKVSVERADGTKVEPKTATPKEEKVEEPVVETVAETDPEQVGEITLSEAQEKRVRDRLAKEELKSKQRLEARLQKLREQEMKKVTKKGERLGLKAEEAQAIQVLKDKIAFAQEQVKQLKADCVNWRKEIQAIRPKSTTTKRPVGTRANKIDPATTVEAQGKIREFLKDNPHTNSDAIITGTGLDRDMYGAALARLRNNGEVEKHARGPYTNYALAGE